MIPNTLMMILLVHLAALASVVAPAPTNNNSSASVFTNEGIPYGYELLPMVYTGPLVPGGPNHTFQGTVEQIVQQVRDKKLDVTFGIPATDCAYTSMADEGDDDNRVGRIRGRGIVPAEPPPRIVCTTHPMASRS